jgi:hypothetical protein
MSLECEVDDGLPIGFVGDIQVLVHDAWESHWLLLDVSSDNLRAFRREQLGDGAPDALSRAGDDCHLALKPTHILPPR